VNELRSTNDKLKTYLEDMDVRWYPLI
jgi:hypothetical protein